MKKGKIIAFANLKGGTGKTTMAEQTLNNLHFRNQKTVLGVDLDHKQESMYDDRQDDISEGLDVNETYDIIKLTPKNLPTELENLKSFYEYIILDLPGSLDDPSVLECYKEVDIIILINSLFKKDLNATYKYLGYYEQEVIAARLKKGLNTNIFMMLNKVNKKQKEYEEFMQLVEEEKFPIPVFTEVVTNNVNMGRSNTYSTIRETYLFHEQLFEIIENVNV